MLRSTAGAMLLRFSRANVRDCSSEMDWAGGVVGEAGPSRLDEEDCWRLWCGSGEEERESWETKASADLEKTKPRWSRV
jgi:hypothetical protein